MRLSSGWYLVGFPMSTDRKRKELSSGCRMKEKRQSVLLSFTMFNAERKAEWLFVLFIGALGRVDSKGHFAPTTLYL